jgi:ribosomal protein L12E/L44/L45/RPP1/RPP2
MDVERTLDDDSLSLLSFCSDDVGSLPGPEEAERLLADLDEYDAAEAAATAAPQPAAPATPDAAPPNTDTRTERAEKLTDWVSVTAPMEEDTEEAEPNSSAHDLVTPTASLGRTVSTIPGRRDEHQMP